MNLAAVTHTHFSWIVGVTLQLAHKLKTLINMEKDLGYLRIAIAVAKESKMKGNLT